MPAACRRQQLILRRTVAVHVVVVVEQRAAHRAARVDHARHQIRAVRVGRAGQRAEVGVANREGVSQRVVERNVAAQVIAHRHVGLVLGPLVVRTVVDGIVRRVPRVVQIADALRAGGLRVQMERQDRLRRIFLRRLIPHRLLAARQRNRETVVVATHAAHMAEVVVERTVLLHEHHNVLDILDRSGARICRYGERIADRFGECGQCGGCTGGRCDGLQETATAI
jgi:hypothetical protein